MGRDDGGRSTAVQDGWVAGQVEPEDIQGGGENDNEPIKLAEKRFGEG